MLPGATDDDRQVVHRILDRHPLLHGHIVVDDQLILRVVAGEKREDTLQFLTLLQSRQELFRLFSQPLVVHRVRFIQNTEGDPTGRAEARNCRGFEKLKLDVAHFLAFTLKFLNDLFRGQLTLRPRLQVDQASPRVRASSFSENFVTGQCRNRVDAIDGLGNLLQFFGFRVCVFERRAWRSLQNPVDHPLVFERDEACGKMSIHEDDANDEGSDRRQCQNRLRDNRAQERSKTERYLLDAAVEGFPDER